LRSFAGSHCDTDGSGEARRQADGCGSGEARRATDGCGSGEARRPAEASADTHCDLNFGVSIAAGGGVAGEG